MPKILVAALAGALALGGALAGTAHAQEMSMPPLPNEQWSFDGIFGTYDRAALQRGFQVYQKVCAACHPLTHLYFRDLEQVGYTPEQIKGIAAQYKVTAGPNKEGKMYERPARPSDHIPGPFPNEEAAQASFGGVAPPDLSLIVNARDGGADYAYAILTGFTNPPTGFTPVPGTFYNAYFPGHHIKMPPPLSANAVKYADGTPATVPQMAHDVASFLAWASNPDLEERHRVGFKVMLFLIIMAGVFYAAKRKIWSRVRH